VAQFLVPYKVFHLQGHKYRAHMPMYTATYHARR